MEGEGGNLREDLLRRIKEVPLWGTLAGWKAFAELGRDRDEESFSSRDCGDEGEEPKLLRRTNSKPLRIVSENTRNREARSRRI